MHLGSWGLPSDPSIQLSFFRLVSPCASLSLPILLFTGSCCLSPLSPPLFHPLAVSLNLGRPNRRIPALSEPSSVFLRPLVSSRSLLSVSGNTNTLFLFLPLSVTLFSTTTSPVTAYTPFFPPLFLFLPDLFSIRRSVVLFRRLIPTLLLIPVSLLLSSFLCVSLSPPWTIVHLFPALTPRSWDQFSIFSFLLARSPSFRRVPASSLVFRVFSLYARTRNRYSFLFHPLALQFRPTSTPFLSSLSLVLRFST